MGSDNTDHTSVRTSEKDNVLTVTIDGDAGARQAERLDASLSKIPSSGHAMVVLDLAGVTFISSLALAALMSFKHRIEGVKGKLRIGPVSLPVLSVLKRVRLTDVLDISEEQKSRQ